MSSDCKIIVDLWKHWNQTTTVDRNNATACCLSSSDIPDVYCTSDGKVTKINWHSQSLRGSIPSSIENLTSLQSL